MLAELVFQIFLLETNVDDWDESEAIECHKGRRPEESDGEESYGRVCVAPLANDLGSLLTTRGHDSILATRIT